MAAIASTSDNWVIVVEVSRLIDKCEGDPDLAVDSVFCARFILPGSKPGLRDERTV